MQVNGVNLVERLHQLPAHPTEGGVVEVAVGIDESKDTLAVLLNVVLGQPDELHIVVVQPLGIALM